MAEELIGLDINIDDSGAGVLRDTDAASSDLTASIDQLAASIDQQNSQLLDFATLGVRGAGVYLQYRNSAREAATGVRQASAAMNLGAKAAIGLRIAIVALTAATVIGLLILLVSAVVSLFQKFGGQTRSLTGDVKDTTAVHQGFADVMGRIVDSVGRAVDVLVRLVTTNRGLLAVLDLVATALEAFAATLETLETAFRNMEASIRFAVAVLATLPNPLRGAAQDALALVTSFEEFEPAREQVRRMGDELTTLEQAIKAVGLATRTELIADIQALRTVIDAVNAGQIDFLTAEQLSALKERLASLATSVLEFQQVVVTATADTAQIVEPENFKFGAPIEENVKQASEALNGLKTEAVRGSVNALATAFGNLASQTDVSAKALLKGMLQAVSTVLLQFAAVAFTNAALAFAAQKGIITSTLFGDPKEWLIAGGVALAAGLATGFAARSISVPQQGGGGGGGVSDGGSLAGAPSTPLPSEGGTTQVINISVDGFVGTEAELGRIVADAVATADEDSR